jgi:hypothetical protein
MDESKQFSTHFSGSDFCRQALTDEIFSCLFQQAGPLEVPVGKNIPEIDLFREGFWLFFHQLTQNSHGIRNELTASE